MTFSLLKLSKMTQHNYNQCNKNQYDDTNNNDSFYNDTVETLGKITFSIRALSIMTKRNTQQIT
jgi:hypothetical protein